MTHPVLDRSPKLRSRADGFGLTSPDIDWRGWHMDHRFACDRGHGFDMRPATLLKGFKRCPVCRDEALLAELHRAAALIQVECLDTQWLGFDAFYRFRCSKAHEWYHDSQSVTCPFCTKAASQASRRLADGLERLQRIASDHGGECLSETYLGSARQHRFQCASGHAWDTAAGDVVRGAWCRLCAIAAKRVQYRSPDGLTRLQQTAAAKGGFCRSTAYAGVKERYDFECGGGHPWQTLGAAVLNGSWCPVCAEDDKSRRQLRADGIDRLRAAAATHSGECLSDTYLGRSRRHWFRCANSHEWETVAYVVLGGAWCRVCADAARRLDFDAVQSAAHSRGVGCAAGDAAGTASVSERRLLRVLRDSDGAVPSTLTPTPSPCAGRA